MADVYRQSIQALLDQLGVDNSMGLHPSEIRARQAEYGRNVLPADKGVNWGQLILGQFTDIMVIILIVAAVISAVLGEATDVVVILAIVALNALLGIYQEYQAEQALAALSRLQVPQVRVRRGGQVREISAEELVPGDIVLLEEGDRVPADGRLIDAVNLQMEEAVLTGESVPVPKGTALSSSAKISQLATVIIWRLWAPRLITGAVKWLLPPPACRPKSAISRPCCSRLKRASRRFSAG